MSSQSFISHPNISPATAHLSPCILTFHTLTFHTPISHSSHLTLPHLPPQITTLEFHPLTITPQISVFHSSNSTPSFRYDLYKIEQELGTIIKPIPAAIDKRLYVAEYQTDEFIASDQDIIKVILSSLLYIYIMSIIVF